MNFLIKLFNKTKIKMEKNQTVLALIAMHAFYGELKETDKQARIAAKVDELLDELAPMPKTEKPAEKKAPEEVKTQHKSHIDPNTPGAKSQSKETTKEKEPPVKPADEKPAEDTDEAGKEPVDDSIIDYHPYIACTVVAKGAKFARPVNATAPKSFKVHKTEEDAEKAGNKLPSFDEIELVFDDAWKMACEAKPNKEILKFLRDELGKYYPELKGDNEWYSKVVNPLAMAVGLIKKQFGYNVKDSTVSVTRPVEKDQELHFDSDIYVKKAEEKKPAENKPEEKKELKTTQKSSTDKAVDEEEQETTPEETPAEDTPANEDVPEDVDLDLGVEEEEERDTTEPPAVSEFDDFNDFETLLFNKIVMDARTAAGMKNEADKKAVQAESREAVRNLIATNFEGEEWTEKIENNWNPKLIKYHNAIVQEISANRAKWSEKTK